MSENDRGGAEVSLASHHKKVSPNRRGLAR